MRNLHRKTLFTQDNSLEVRVEQLERRYATPELEYVLTDLSVLTPNVGPGDTEQLLIDDQEFPFGQYGFAFVPTGTESLYGYSCIDNYIQSNTFGKGGYYHVFVNLNITLGAPAATNEAALGIVMEIWDDTDSLVGAFNPIWTFYGVDNRTDLATDDLFLRSQAMYWHGALASNERLRWKALISNSSAGDTFTLTPKWFQVIRYGQATGSAGGGSGA